MAALFARSGCTMLSVPLDNRARILLGGPDAERFLQNIITTDLDALREGEARPGALLTPQGKILFDFLVSRRGPEGLRLGRARRQMRPGEPARASPDGASSVASSVASCSE